MSVCVVVGFCGAGKSTLMMDLQRQGLFSEIIHDYYAKTLKQNGYRTVPESSYFFNTLKECLENDEDIAVADPLFVIESEMNKFIDFVKSLRPGIEVNIIAFTNEPEAAKQNIRDRSHRNDFSEASIQKFCDFIDQNAEQYIPEKLDALIAPTYGGILYNDIVTKSLK